MDIGKINNKFIELLKETIYNPNQIANEVPINAKTIRGYFEEGKPINKVALFIWIKEKFPNLNLNWLIADAGPQWLEEEINSVDNISELKKIYTIIEERFEKVEKAYKYLEKENQEIKAQLNVLKKMRKQ